MKKFLAAIALTVISTFASADELIFLGASHHGERAYEENGVERHYNETNLGVVYFNGNGFGLGVYKNSYYKTSIFVAKRYLFNEYIGVMGGLATGYQGHTKGILAGVVLRSSAVAGWRLNFAGQPFGRKYQIMTFSISKEF